METTTHSTFEKLGNNIHQKLQDAGFSPHSDDRFTAVYLNETKGTIACILKEEYIPIEFFKSTFNSMTEVIRQGKYKRFVFDKRSLNTFHQPTMEWYFIHWKKEMLAYGLFQHKKILPELDWFKKAVMIAKDDLMTRYPENVISRLDITYCDTLEEALA